MRDTDGDARVRTHLAALLEHGYVVLEGAIREALCKDVCSDIDAFKRLNRQSVERVHDEQERLVRIVNLHLVVESLTSVFSTSDALPVCDAFFDAETALYTSLYFERGSQQDLHRDSPLFVTRPAGRYLGMWTALEDVDADNGPLVVVPGSHALPELDVEAMAVDLYGAATDAPPVSDVGWQAYQTAVLAQTVERSLDPVEVHVRRGDVILWHPSLMHGGAPHRSDARTRRSVAMHVTPVGVPVYHQDVFFNPTRAVSDRAPWGYHDHGGRSVATFGEVDFAHQFTVPIDELTRPRTGLLERVTRATRGARRLRPR